MDDQNILSDNGGESDDDVVDMDEETLTTSTNTNEPNKAKPTRKVRSPVWKIFKKLPLDKDNIQKAKCRLCKCVYKASSSNGTVA